MCCSFLIGVTGRVVFTFIFLIFSVCIFIVCALFIFVQLDEQALWANHHSDVVSWNRKGDPICK